MLTCFAASLMEEVAVEAFFAVSSATIEQEGEAVLREVMGEQLADVFVEQIAAAAAPRTVYHDCCYPCYELCFSRVINYQRHCTVLGD